MHHSHQRKYTTFCQPMLRISQTTWTQHIQHSQYQLVLEPEELLSTLKQANHHAKLVVIAQEPIFNQFQDQM